MISLSKAWAHISRELYGKEFLDELAELLQKQGVKKILECGCGDGYILHGLAQRGFNGFGIDLNEEMIALGLKDHQHTNISYQIMNWQDAQKLSEQFDAVICRGNSLPHIVSWEHNYLNPEKTREGIGRSIQQFFEKLREGGLLYLDTCSQYELDKKGRNIEIDTKKVRLSGSISYDNDKRIRIVAGRGIILGKPFEGRSTSLVITPDELESMVRSYSPSVVWRPKLISERNYDIVCAVK